MATATDPLAYELCERAWQGRKGYVFLSVRDPRKDKTEPGYWKDVAFAWPDDSSKIRATLHKARRSANDIYWSPHVYADRYRSREAVANATTLFADLDEVNPKDLPQHLKPTAAWQTSPGRWQAMWEMTRTLHPDTQQELNQRLTYAIGADKGGWDLTQVLRTPGTPNHKYPEEPHVKLLWLNGHKVDPVKLIDDLPEVEGGKLDRSELEDIPDQSFILSRHRVSARAKQLIKARRTSGDRSARLWELECLLAEAGLSEREVVGVVQPTVWNKFSGRHDELRQLSAEARKAVAHSGPAPIKTETNGHKEQLEVVDEEEESHGPVDWGTFDRDHQAVSWMVADIWGESEVGFISGHPKSYKSWLALDLAVSVATGTRFLGAFASKKHNVLLIQEEDPKPVLQERLTMVGSSKGLIGWEENTDGTLDMWYELPDNLYIISNQGFTINEEWLEQLEEWIKERDIKLVIIDPLMMVAEAVDEFKAFEFMAQILKPLKRLRSRTNAAIVVVHHHTKGGETSGAKAMYGSVALWAWEEAALHLNVVGVGHILAERFSKHALLSPLNIEVGELANGWGPQVGKVGSSNLYDVMVQMENGATVDELVSYTSLGRDAVDRQLKQLEKEEKVEKIGQRNVGPGRPRTIWRIKS